VTVVVEVPVAGLTTTVVEPDDAEQFALSVYTAVMVCVPGVAKVIPLSVTVAGEVPVTGSAPSTVMPSKNTTVPPAGLPAVQVTVAVADVVAPTVTGDGEVTVVVLVSTFTVVVPLWLEQPVFVLL
jgi:hypothetical protein